MILNESDYLRFAIRINGQRLDALMTEKEFLNFDGQHISPERLERLLSRKWSDQATIQEI